MTIQLLTAKQLHMLAKKGYTPEDLQSRYECTDEELRARIRQLYRQGTDEEARAIYKGLEANRKKARPKKESTNPVNCEEETTTEESTTEKPANEVATQPSEENTRSLDELAEEEHDLSTQVMDLEERYNALKNRHRLCIGGLQDLRLELSRIQSRLEHCQTEFDQAVAEANEVSREMNEISSLRREKKVALEAVRHEIEVRKSVTVYVFEDGRIEAPDSPDFVLDDEGYLDLKDELLKREECLDLRVRDIVVLARLLAIADSIDGLKLTPVCENAELETTFSRIRGS